MYTYQALVTDRSIRALDLLPGPSGSTVQVEIREDNLDNCDPFIALSYTWADANGDKSRSVTIQCREKGNLQEPWMRLLVTKNCLAALQQLRSDRETQSFWIDAICIDQENDKEKELQIPLMRDIYSNARQVVLWLGEGTPQSDEALSFISDLTKEIQSARQQGLRVTEQPLFRQLIDAAGTGSNHPPTGTQATFFANVFEIFNRDWWRRVWIIQEVALARDPWLVCGGYRIPYSDIEVLNEVLRDNIPAASSRVGAFTMYTTTQTHIRAYVQGDHTQLPLLPVNSSSQTLEILRRARRCDATVAVDHVYGIQGLFKPAENILPTPDLANSTANVFADVVRAVVQHSGSLDILCDCSGESTLRDLPRWAPDWSMPDLNAFRPELYNAAASSCAQVTFSGRAVLAARGVFVDTLTWIGTQARPTPANTEGDRHAGQRQQRAYDLDCIRAWRAWLDTALPLIQADDRGTEWPAFWRALCFDSPSGLTGRLGAQAPSLGVSANHWQQIMRAGKAESVEFVTYALNNHGRAAEFYHRVRTGTVGRALGRVEGRRWANVPGHAREGDRVVLLAGAKVPHVVRPQNGEDGKMWMYVGSCYLHGVMDGEAFPGLEELEVIEIC